MVYSSKDILEILPHRFPFLLVDRVLQLNQAEGASRVGHKAVCLKNVSINEPFFSGHFPDMPIMPGVLQVEAMAQAAALAYYRKTDPELDFMIVSVEECKFRKPVLPGDTLIITAEIVKDRAGAMIQVVADVKVENQMVAEAKIMAVVAPKSKRK